MLLHLVREIGLGIYAAASLCKCYYLLSFQKQFSFDRLLGFWWIHLFYNAILHSLLLLRIFWICLGIWYGNASNWKLNLMKMKPNSASYQVLLLNFFLCVSCFIFLRSNTFEVFLFEPISRICRSATYLYAGLYGINLYACWHGWKRNLTCLIILQKADKVDCHIHNFNTGRDVS